MPKIVGLAGFARTGKDTIADELIDVHGFTKISFASPMRWALEALNPIIRYDLGSYVRLQDVIKIYGWDGYKESPYGAEIRALMQRFGTEVGREIFGQDFWIEQAFRIANQYDKVVFSDVRFINEAEAIKSVGGEVWRVERPGVGPANGHKSETELTKYENYDYIIYNDSDIKTLSWKVAECL